MSFRFSHPVTVRYSDLDAQGHLNNARYFSFLEEARLYYAMALGLWSAENADFSAMGQIVAEASCTYKKAVQLGQTVDIAIRVARLGTKSIETLYRLTVNGEEVATARTVQVAFDYRTQRSVAIPEEWRARVKAFEAEVLEK